MTFSELTHSPNKVFALRPADHIAVLLWVKVVEMG